MARTCALRRHHRRRWRAQNPESLKEQLKIGGRLVIPVGRDPKLQELVRVTRLSESEYHREDLADVRFVPLVGQEGWAPAEPARPAATVSPYTRLPTKSLAGKIAAACEPFETLKPRDWIDCSRASATQGSCCLEKRATEHRNFTGCAIGFRAN